MAHGVGAKIVVALKRTPANLYFVSNATEHTNMTNLAAIIVEIFSMGTLSGDIFMELQAVFQNARGDMGATPIAHFSVRGLQTLCDRGFVVAHYNYEGRFDGYVPSDRAEAALTLELASGQRGCIEPRDAFDARLVVIRPVWAEPASGLGMAV